METNQESNGEGLRKEKPTDEFYADNSLKVRGSSPTPRTTDELPTFYALFLKSMSSSGVVRMYSKPDSIRLHASSASSAILVTYSSALKSIKCV